MNYLREYYQLKRKPMNNNKIFLLILKKVIQEDEYRFHCSQKASHLFTCKYLKNNIH